MSRNKGRGKNKKRGQQQLDPLCVKLVAFAQKLQGLRPWLTFGGDEAFFARIPDLSDPALVVVMGQMGMDYGLFVDIGPGAFDRWLTLQEASCSMPEVVRRASLLSITFEPWRELEPELRAPLKRAGLRGCRTSTVPNLMGRLSRRTPSHADAWRTAHDELVG